MRRSAQRLRICIHLCGNFAVQLKAVTAWHATQAGHFEKQVEVPAEMVARSSSGQRCLNMSVRTS